MSIRENILKVRSEIARASSKSGVDGVTLVGISKTFGLDEMKEAISHGITDIGENRIQEAESKFPHVENVRKHFVGHLQTNKVSKAVEICDMIQSVDSMKLAKKISGKCLDSHKVMPVLVQIRTDEEKDFGISPEEAKGFIRRATILKGIRIQGLMTIGPYHENPEDSRPVFRKVKYLFDSLRDIPGAEMRHLSMGMSGDFGMAIEEGSNMVRVGTAMFGLRDNNRI